MRTISNVSHRECFLKILIFLKEVWVSLTSFDRSVICEPRVASVFRSSCTNLGLVSLFSTASVWVPLIVIRTLQYQINKCCYIQDSLVDCKTYIEKLSKKRQVRTWQLLKRTTAKTAKMHYWLTSLILQSIDWDLLL